jgi:hypothetical protein
MNYKEFKKLLSEVEQLQFRLPNGQFVPPHFHVTEVGKIEKHYIDCGGTIRNEYALSFQLWEADDFDHRLAPSKLLQIVSDAEAVLGLTNEAIEVEYQGATIERYGLNFNGIHFELTPKQTACLAEDACGIPKEKMKVRMTDLTANTSCKPGSGCC